MPKLNFSFSKKRLLLLGFLFVLLLAIPLTIYLAQQQQQTQSHANPNTTLSFVPNPYPSPVAAGDKLPFDILVSPGGNLVYLVKLAIKFDPTKLSATKDSFTADTASGLSVVEGPTITNDTFTVTLSVSPTDPTRVLQTNTKVGTITFDVIDKVAGSTEVSFDSNQINIRSVNRAGGDLYNENVFLSGKPADVVIKEPSLSTTPTVAATTTPTAEPTDTTPTDTVEPTGATPTDTGTPIGSPVCESLAIAPSAVGTAPFDVTFTVAGNDTDGTINKVTFNYGDGPTEDVTTGGGLGTDTVSLDQSHTYQTSGSFVATAQFTDDQGNVSDTSTCSQTMTVSGGGEATNSATITPLAATGPNNTIVGLGAIGGILFVIGALLFLAL